MAQLCELQLMDDHWRLVVVRIDCGIFPERVFLNASFSEGAESQRGRSGESVASDDGFGRGSRPRRCCLYGCAAYGGRIGAAVEHAAYPRALYGFGVGCRCCCRAGVPFGRKGRGR